MLDDQKRCEDQTVAGIFKQSQGTSLTAPFTKISISKVLLFTDAKAKEDYFKQQSDFVNRNRNLDKLAEFSTNIEVPGYTPKLLAVQPTHTTRATYFWFFTLLGLTVPFRIWFARRCDELRIAVVKEISAVEPTKVNSGGAAGTLLSLSPSSIMTSWLTKSSWFGSSSTGAAATQTNALAESFRSRMEEMSLYERAMTPNTTNTTTLAIEGEDGAIGQVEKEEEDGLQSLEHNSTDVYIVNSTITTNTTHVSDDSSTDDGSNVTSQANDGSEISPQTDINE